MGNRRRRARHPLMWAPTADLRWAAGHRFDERVNRMRDESGFDAFGGEQCAKFYADVVGRPSLPPGRYLRVLLLGLEGLEPQRATAWRACVAQSLRPILDVPWHEPCPRQSKVSRTRRRIGMEVNSSHEPHSSSTSRRRWEIRPGSRLRRSPFEAGPARLPQSSGYAATVRCRRVLGQRQCFVASAPLSRSPCRSCAHWVGPSSCSPLYRTRRASRSVARTRTQGRSGSARAVRTLAADSVSRRRGQCTVVAVGQYSTLRRDISASWSRSWWGTFGS